VTKEEALLGKEKRGRVRGIVQIEKKGRQLKRQPKGKGGGERWGRHRPGIFNFMERKKEKGIPTILLVKKECTRDYLKYHGSKGRIVSTKTNRGGEKRGRVGGNRPWPQPGNLGSSLRGKTLERGKGTFEVKRNFRGGGKEKLGGGPRKPSNWGSLLGFSGEMEERNL